jgi:hypothetical protein
MTKYKIMELLYGEDPPFVYDTATPDNLMRSIVKTVAPEAEPGSDAYAQVYAKLWNCVYAYGRHSQGVLGEGLIPLTKDAWFVLIHYQELTGHTIIFTPTFQGD